MRLDKQIALLAALSLCLAPGALAEDISEEIPDNGSVAAEDFGEVFEEEVVAAPDEEADVPFVQNEEDTPFADEDEPVAETAPAKEITASPEEIAAAKAWEAQVYGSVAVPDAPAAAVSAEGAQAGFNTGGLTAEAQAAIAAIDEETEPWMIRLFNRDNPIPSDWEVGSLAEVKGGQKVSRRILPALQEMFNAARKENINPQVNSGYRTRSKQESLMKDKYKEYLKDGMSEEEAKAKAEEWVATPGTSEHEAGVGIDIRAGSGHTDDVYAWMAANSWKYGFILRYPESKQSITGIMNEPWHFRYVGKKAAAEMYATGECLEEYLERKGLYPDGTDGTEQLPEVQGNLLDDAADADGLPPLVEEG